MKAFDEIRFFKQCIPEKAIQNLIDEPKESVPLLLNELKLAVERRKNLGNYYVGHIFSLLLLARLKEKKAYKIVIEILNLPHEEIDRLFGDLLLVSLPSIILNVYDGDAESLLKILDNKKIDYAIRNVVGASLVSLIYNKMLDPKVVVEHIKRELPQKIKDEDRVFLTVMCHIVLGAKLEELYPEMRQAFKSNLIEQFFISAKDFEDALQLPTEKIVFPDYLNPEIDLKRMLSDFEDYAGTDPVQPQIDPEASCPCGSLSKFKDCCKSRI